MTDLDNPESKLSRISPLIDGIRETAGTLGLSVGVLHHGKVVYKAHFGQRSLSEPSPPNDDTIYYLASLTKAFTAAAVADLVEEGRLNWDLPVVNYLPQFRRDDDVGRNTTLVDLLSHRTGLTRGSALWVQRRQRFMMPKSETVRVVTTLKPAVQFRSSFVYNNWGYGLVEATIEQVTGVSYSSFIEKTFIEPLGLKRTTMEVVTDPNKTSSNTNHNDGVICPITAPPQSDKTGLAGAGALKSSLTDLLHAYRSLLAAHHAELAGDDVRTHPEHVANPFRQAHELFRAQMPISSDDTSKHGYALGWIRTLLPHSLGTISMNPLFLGHNDLPVIGVNSPGLTVLHHHGSLLGGLSAVYLVPESSTAIVVLANTLGMSDTADWVAQLILQTLIGETPHDYRKWTNQTRDALLTRYAELSSKLEAGRTKQPPPKDLQLYCGRYINGMGNFVLDVTAHPDGSGLVMQVQEFEDVRYHLLHYSGDIFYWPCDREQEMCTEMMFPWLFEGVHKISFESSGTESMQSLLWQFDAAVDPEQFLRVL